MLLLGPVRSIQETSNTVIYNFSSLSEKYTKLYLYPPNDLGALSEYDFDVRYYNYILNNDTIFFDFMMIIYSLYQGKDVFLVIDDDIRLEPLNESLMKIIQQRYGYNGNYIRTEEDFLYATEGSFSVEGLYNLDIDKERLSYMLESTRISNGGKVYDIY